MTPIFVSSTRADTRSAPTIWLVLRAFPTADATPRIDCMTQGSTPVAPAQSQTRAYDERSGVARFIGRATPYLFLLPGVVLVATLLLWPFVRTLYLSFTNSNGTNSPAWVGLGNYNKLLHDRVLSDAMTNTLL